MTFTPAAMAVAWFRPEDYERIREEWRSVIQGRLDAKFKGQIVEKVMVDPDELLAFARERFGGKVDGQTRAGFAAFALAKKYGNAPNN